MDRNQYEILRDGIGKYNMMYFEMFQMLNIHEKREYVEHMLDDIFNIFNGYSRKCVLPIKKGLRCRSAKRSVIGNITWFYSNANTCILDITLTSCELIPAYFKGRTDILARVEKNIYSAEQYCSLVFPNDRRKRRISREVINSSSPLIVKRMRKRTRLSRIINSFFSKHKSDKGDDKTAKERWVKRFRRFLYKLI